MTTFQQVELARQQLSEAEATRAARQMAETWEKGILLDRVGSPVSFEPQWESVRGNHEGCVETARRCIKSVRMI